MTTGFCQRCGAPLPQGAFQCGRCGAPVTPQAAAPPPPPPTPAPPPPQVTTPTPQYTPTTPPPGTGQGPPQQQRQRRNLLILVAAVAVLALVIGVLFVTRGGKGGEGGTTGGAEIFLEPATAVGSDPFTTSVDTNTAPAPVRLTASRHIPTTTSTTVATTTTSLPATPTTQPPQTVRSVNATAPGLYGGTRNNAACNQEQMISFLQENPSKAAAWAGVQGISTADIPTYIRSLTPVVLRADTRVTNYGYRNGRANAKQTVLQAGTAVLVDEYGIPRARCYCGNPLSPPIAQPSGTRYVGDPWPGWDPTTVIVVVNTTNVVITDFVLVDLNGGYFGRTPPKASTTGTFVDGEVYVDSICDMFPDLPDCQTPVATTTTLPEPTLGTGDIQFTLRWSSTADLDLAVLDPNGEEINYTTPTSSSGGQLDVDSNQDCETAVGNPVENIFWPTGMSPNGTYMVAVSYYGECGAGAGPQAYTLTVTVDGVVVDVQSVTSGFRFTGGTLNAPGDRNIFSYKKDPSQPIVPAATTTTTPPTTTAPAQVPVTTQQPVGSTPTTAAPGEAIPLDEYCAAKYPPPDDYTNMMWVLCMHDPTVNDVSDDPGAVPANVAPPGT